MKILAISDVPSKALWDYGTREHLEGIDLILSCGDLPQKYLEYLTNFTAAPILYVHGNHDGSYRENEPGGCICVDDSVYVWKGLRIMGLGGSIRYNNREDSFQYTEREMRRRAHIYGTGNAPPCAQALTQGSSGGRHRSAADPFAGSGSE